MKDYPFSLTQDDFPEPYYTLCEIVGIDKTIEIAKKLGGTRWYFMRVNSLFREKRDRAILEEFDGGNYKELSSKYHLTESRIFEIVKEQREKLIKKERLNT